MKGRPHLSFITEFSRPVLPDACRRVSRPPVSLRPSLRPSLLPLSLSFLKPYQCVSSLVHDLPSPLTTPPSFYSLPEPFSCSLMTPSLPLPPPSFLIPFFHKQCYIKTLRKDYDNDCGRRAEGDEKQEEEERTKMKKRTRKTRQRTSARKELEGKE